MLLRQAMLSLKIVSRGLGGMLMKRYNVHSRAVEQLCL